MTTSTTITTSKSKSQHQQPPWLLKEKEASIIQKVAQSWLWIAVFTIVNAAVILYHDKSREGEDAAFLRDLESSNQNDPYEEDFKPLFPLTTSDWLGFTCATVGLMIAAGGGIGGGGILVPIYILVMGFSPKHAIPLSNITVFGGAVANTLLNASKRHPLADRPLVDWDLILVMEPLTIGGALLGAFLNKVLPDAFIVVMLVVLLSFTAYKSLTKAMKMYKLETLHMKQHQAVAADDDDEEEEGYVEMSVNHHKNEQPVVEAKHSAGEPLVMDEKDPELINTCSACTNDVVSTTDELPPTQTQSDGLMTDDFDQEAALKVILEEERHVPMTNITILVALFVVVLFINIMKGGGAFESPIGIECGGPGFWAANALMLLWIVLVSIRARSYLVQRYYQKQQCRYPYVEGDIQWDAKATIVYPLLCMLAGFFAGMFGIGGGIVKGPLMLAMGVHPAVSSASSACMILFTSFTATTSFVVFGLLQLDYAGVCVALGFVATVVGQLVLNALMKKYQRNSYIAFSIGVVVLLSAILMTIQGLVSMTESGVVEAGENSGGGGVCGVSSH
mmetsp:Transcript_16709/g.25240  ORF Transcript_16709/g.25240 Transcript_16709/m.25240 type:complete len:562 (-) Transcript_16709:41-1726(-)